MGLLNQAETRSLVDDPPLRNPEELIATRMAARRFEVVLSSLPSEFREVLILVDVQELNYQEIADVLEIPLGTVKSRVSRARAMIRKAMLKAAVSRGKTGS